MTVVHAKAASKAPAPVRRKAGRAAVPAGAQNTLQASIAQRYDNVALVLQGGGALGSYQAGVIQGLLDARIEPNWVAGISIGALNTAVIAGNAPEDRQAALEGFWNTICRPAMFPALMGALGENANALGEQVRKSLSQLAATRAMLEGQQGFFTPRAPAWLTMWQTMWQTPKPSEVSFYDTSALKETLLKYADFERINKGPMRVSLGAVNVETGNFVYFDNTRDVLLPEHFMASGALPPGFPAVEIDGQFYWDGGLVSNTPLSEVLGEMQQQNTLVFQVDLWSAEGPLPSDLAAISERTKDIQFSSRTRMVTDQVARTQRNAVLLKELLSLIPEAKRKDNAWCAQAEALANSGTANIIQLIYKNKSYETYCKDYEFSLDTMREHWATGLEDLQASLAQREWFEVPDAATGIVTHDIHRVV